MDLYRLSVSLASRNARRGVGLRASFPGGSEDDTVTYGELNSLLEQFFALVEATVRLPPGAEQWAAVRDVREYGERMDQSPPES